MSRYGGIARTLRVIGTCAGAAVALAVAPAWLFTTPARAYTVVSCGAHPNEVFQHTAVFGINTSAACPSTDVVTGSGLGIQAGPNVVANGQRAYWLAQAPPGLAIRDAYVPAMAINDINLGHPYGGGFFWGPSDSDGAIYDAFASSYGPIGADYGTAGFPSADFGFQIVCGASTCDDAAASAYLSEVDLTVQESGSPSIAAGGLWNQPGWVRGDWPISANGDSPSGVCGLVAAVDGQAVVSRSFGADPSAWHQCDAIGQGGLTGTIHTTQFPNGSDSLAVLDSDAAGNSNGASETIHVDNQAPTIALSGPTDALATAGTQYVTASVGAGPSGAYGAQCSVDGGPSTLYSGASVQIPVAGIGAHTVTCTAQSNAVSVNGQRATSAPASFGLTIRQPTVEAITFSHIVDHLRCRTVTRTVRVRTRRHVVRRHGRRVVVRGRIRHVKRRVRRCRARIGRRHVYVVLKRHGRPVRRHGRIVRVRRVRRVVLLPHRVYKTTRRIGHGRHTTVSGFLGLPDGTALSGRTITVLGAADNGHAPFVPVSSATTDADGVWVAKVPAGPSRLLEAVYGGDTTTEPAGSTTVTLEVPARIRLAIAPRILPWRGAIHIRGRLVGGYVPHDGVALRLLVRYTHSRQRTPLQALRTDRRGRFDFTWSYHAGRGVATYPFSIATTATESDYPFAAASSRRVKVTFGRRTPHHHHRHRHRHRTRHRHRAGRVGAERPQLIGSGIGSSGASASAASPVAGGAPRSRRSANP